MMLSRDNDAFAEGLEFEETFPETSTPAPEQAAPAPAPASPPRLTVVRDAPVDVAPAPEPPAPPAPEPALTADHFDELVLRIDRALQASLDQRIEQRLATFRAEIDRAFASRPAAPAAPAPERKREPVDPVRDAMRAAASARDVARVMRDAVNGLNETAGFAVAVHHPMHDEVVYRYRVAVDEELGAALRRDGLDDGPDGAAAHADGWVHGKRTLRVGPRNVIVHTHQCAIRDGDHNVGVLTLQTVAKELSEPVLVRVAALAATAAPRLAELRDANALRGA